MAGTTEGEIEPRLDLQRVFQAFSSGAKHAGSLAVYIPERTKAEYSKLIDELVEEGRKVHQSFKKETQWRQSAFGSVGRTAQPKEVTVFDREAFATWKTRCIALTDALLPVGTGLSKYLQFGAVETNGASVEYAIGRLSCIFLNLVG
jgi:hypothetical protein